MFRCDECRPLLVDHLYGLLDTPDAVAVDMHLADCVECSTARTDAAKFQGLLGRAAKSPFPAVQFTPPAEPVVPASPLAVPSVNGRHAPSDTASRQPTVTQAWVRWVIAASLLLAFAALGGPAAKNLIGYAWNRPDVDRDLALLNEEREKRDAAEAAYAEAKRKIDEQYAAEKKAHDEIVAKWVKAQKDEFTLASSRPFQLEVSGPATAVVGAQNDYPIRVPHSKGAVTVTAQVKDAAGKLVYESPIDVKDNGGVLNLPADVWAKADPGSELALRVVAFDPKSGTKSEVAETIRITDPVFTTFLTTDKPMYRPGESVYFRSLTLDRARLLPPERDMTLRFVLHDPSGQAVTGSESIGRDTPAALQPNGIPAVVTGPDGKPIHGVGTGAIPLSAKLPGGEYTLAVYEMSRKPAASTKPLATRKFLVNAYTLDQLQKSLEFDGRSYGPGDTVTVTLKVMDQGKPLVNAAVTMSAQANGKEFWKPKAAKTNPAGVLRATFTLPTTGELTEATLSVTVKSSDGKVIEAIVRPIPLASKKVSLEFFPEGGDLIEGVSNRVYFRATTSLGKPADVQGTLTDGTRVLTRVSTLTDAEHPGVNQGLGSFTYTPQPGKGYALRLDRPSGVVQPLVDPLPPPNLALLGGPAGSAQFGYPLPAAKAAGVVLHLPDGVTKPGQPIRATLTAAGTKRAMLVGAYVRGQAIGHQRTTLEPGTPTELAIPTGDTTIGGVVRVTVFEEIAGQPLKPVAERLVYRQPGRELKLGYTANRSDFAPGDRVQLDITAATESGQPTPAILWAAVVNQSVISMADDKTGRLLPTHFLLNGEVRQPDELERADFLLTDNPKANAALDLLLGTQGWRRFAEQDPARFRRTVPADETDHLLTASLTTGPVVLSPRDSSERLIDANWPKYETTLAKLRAAKLAQEQALQPSPELTAAQAAYQRRLTDFGTSASRLEYFEGSVAEWRGWLIVAVAALLIVAVALALVRGQRPAEDDIRVPLGRGVLALSALAAFVLFTITITGIGNETWKQAAAYAPRPQRHNPYEWAQATVQSQLPTTRPSAVAPREVGLFDAGSNEKQPAIPSRNPNPKTATQPSRPIPKRLSTPPSSIRNDVVNGAQRFPVGIASELPQELTSALFRTTDRAFAARMMAILQNGLPPQSPPLVVREYAHARLSPTDGTRTDFTETLLWQPVLVVPGSGKATVQFQLSDAVAPYQVLIAGHTLDGRIGAVTGMIEVHKPFAVDPKLPQEIGSADKLDVPIGLTNMTGKPTTAKVTVTPTGMAVEGGVVERTVEMTATGGRTFVRLVPSKSEGTLAVKVNGSAAGLSDSIERTLTVVPDGYPHLGSRSDVLEKVARANVSLPKEWIPGTLKVAVSVYPNTLSEIQGGLDGLLREPYGCFEQTSTTNYPNVLILDYLRETNQTNPEVTRRANELMERGYQRLVGFECPETPTKSRKGFEWFGAADRPHELLTAYGLLQFTDMSRVHSVDAEMLKRTKKFLLDGRDGNGGFRRKQGQHGAWGSTPGYVSDAYTVWALTEAERNATDRTDLSKELDALLQHARDGKAAKDPYFLALTAGALLNRGRTDDGIELLKAVASFQLKDGSVAGAETSITRSTGRDLLIETTAMAVLGWLKANRPEPFAEAIRSAVGWIGQQRGGYGGFGSTQATILSLKALIEHSKANKRPAESGELRIFVGGKLVGTKAFSTTTPGPIVFEVPTPETTFNAGDSEVRVETTAKEAYPVTVRWECRTRTPNSSPTCAVALGTKLDKSKLDEGDTARLAVRVENRADAAQGMVVAIVGIPAGLKLPEDMKQLKNLTAHPVDGSEPTVSYWETRGRELILYWRGLSPKQTVSFGLELIAEVPGEYRGPASRAYLYYNADHKHWVEPVDVYVTVKP